MCNFVSPFYFSANKYICWASKNICWATLGCKKFVGLVNVGFYLDWGTGNLKNKNIFLALIHNQFSFPLQDNLLPTALSLIQSYRTQPSHIICFPIVKSEYINQYQLLCQSLASNVLNTSLNPVLPMTENGQRDSLTFNSASSQGTDGVLSHKIDSLTSDEDVSKSNTRTTNHHAALQFCLKDQVIWPSPNSHKGFSMSMWLRMEASDLHNGNNGDWMSRETVTESRGLWDILNGSSKRRPLPDRLRMAMKRHFDSRHWSNQCLHLVSIGNSMLMFEVWADPRIANLIFR